MKEREPLSWSHPVGGTWWPRSLVGWSAIRVDAHRWVSRPTVRHTRSGPTATSSFDALVQAAFPADPLDTTAISNDFPLSDLCGAASRDPTGPRLAVRHQARAAPGDLIHPSATPSASDAIGRRTRSSYALIPVAGIGSSVSEHHPAALVAVTYDDSRHLHDQTGRTMTTAPARGPETVSERSVRQRSRSVTCAAGLQPASWASGRLAGRPHQAARTDASNPG
jgi:hypothetical protein